MALREFRDDDGRTWNVWETYPTGADAVSNTSALARYMAAKPHATDQNAGFVRPEFEMGWLTFTCGSERRRLTPVPAGWEGEDEATLRDDLAHAENAPQRVTPPAR